MEIELNNYYQHVYNEISYALNNNSTFTEYFVTCPSHDNTYRARSLKVHIGGNVKITYYVYHCDPNNFLVASLGIDCFQLDVPSTKIMVDHLFNLLWTHTVCSECYNLVPIVENSSQPPLCQDCYPMKMFMVWGIINNKNMLPSTCCICLDQVYQSRLQCGHMVHKTCFIRVGVHQWFDSDNEYLCPLCRTAITDDDKQNFFLYY